MKKYLLNTFALLVLSLSLTSLSTEAQVTTPDQKTVVRSDGEYDRYRLRADDFFRTGRYEDARRQYRNCLEVPGFESDAYATERIDRITKCLTLLQRANDAVQEQKPDDLLSRLADVLELNPVDPIVSGRLAEFYLTEGNNLFQQKKYEAAKAQYQKAKPFAEKTGNRTLSNTLDLQIRNSTVTYVTPKRTGLKIGMGILALGTGFYAASLQNDFTTKNDALAVLAKATDPEGNGVINTSDQYERYTKAYMEAEAARDRRGLFVACLSVATLATVTELYLLLKKAKPRPVTGFHWKPSTTSYGLAIGYLF